MDLFEPLTDQELEELDTFLLNLECEESVLGLSELDGLLTAVVSGPELILPAEWLDAVWGGPESSPPWESEEQFNRILNLIMRHMNYVAAVLMEAPDQYEPLFMEHQVEGRTYTIVAEWCEGFTKGLSLRADAWNIMPNAADDYLAPILIFTTETGFELIEDMELKEIEFWQRQIEPAVRRIHAHWLEQRSHLADPAPFPTSAANDEPFVHSTAKVGRNEPCPCGSGKKYKKCCGLN